MAKAKAQAVAARFATEVAPPPLLPVVRPGKVPRSLDTIAEDDGELLAAAYGPSSEHQGFAAALSRRRAAEKARELISRCFSDAHGQQQQAVAAPAVGRVAITS